MARKSKAEIEFWKDINPTCMKCVHDCKQSAFAELVKCKKKKLKKVTKGVEKK